ncbi:MAG TPA: ABC transporter substrate-binding protein [Chloroflexota bacterium]|nr:ABC transporter substrate-binding protein [Chloroflexota bacterium]
MFSEDAQAMQPHDPLLSRRDILRLTAVGALAGAAGLTPRLDGVFAATSGAPVEAAKPKRGGRLRVGHVGGGTAETVDPHMVVAPVDNARAVNLFDRLTRLKPDLTVEMELAESFEPNATATSWTARLRKGVTWHDGKPLTADDVIYTLRRIGGPKSTFIGASTIVQIDIAHLKKLDNLTVRMPLKQAIAELPLLFTGYFMGIVQNGAKSFKHPIGTGAFMFESFTPGQSSLFKRNPNYWKTGQPYVDDLEILSIPDQGARLNALIGGQVDAIEYVNYAQAKSQMSLQQINLLVAQNSNVVPITMSCDLAPFKDVRVRQAFRLIADRPALVNAAQLGFGTIGNDLFGKGFQGYDTALPQRHQDLDQARSLLKKAGQSNLQVTLYSSKAAPGMLESATAFAEQAKAAGVTISVHNGPADSYYSNNYLKWNFGQTQWNAYPIIVWMQQALLSNAPYNETHWYRPEWDKLFNEAIGTLDAGKRQTLMFEVQKQLWDEGGYLMWGFAPQIDGLAKYVRGAVPNPAAALGAYDYRDFWLDK